MSNSVIYFIDTDDSGPYAGPAYGVILDEQILREPLSWDGWGIRSRGDGPSACEWIIPEGPAFTLPDEENGLVGLYLFAPTRQRMFLDTIEADILDIIPVTSVELSPSACVRIFS